MEFIYLIFYACLRLRFLDVETNPLPRRPGLLSAEYSVEMCETWPEALVTRPWLRLSMIYSFALRLWSQICVTCRSCWFPVSVSLSCCVGARCLGCDNQFVVGPTHARGGTLDLLMTDVPDLVRVAVVAPIGNSDHSSLSAVISMAQAVPNLCVGRKVFLKHQVNWNTVCGAIRELPWLTIWLSDNPVEVLNEHLSHAGWTLFTNQGHPGAKQG